MSAPSSIRTEHLILGGLILDIENFLRVNNRQPWRIEFVSRGETGVTRTDFQANRVETPNRGIFRAYGTIDGEPAEILFFSEPGAASLLYMK